MIFFSYKIKLVQSVYNMMKKKKKENIYVRYIYISKYKWFFANKKREKEN